MPVYIMAFCQPGLRKTGYSESSSRYSILKNPLNKIENYGSIRFLSFITG